MAEASCTLVALPQHARLEGRVVDQFGGAIVGAKVLLTGGTNANLVSDPNGEFSLGELPAGSYRARVESSAHLVHVVDAELTAGETSQLQLVLLARPANAGVRVAAGRIHIPALRFDADSNVLNTAAAMAVAELADLLLRDVSIARVVIGGGGGERSSDARGQAVRQRLIQAGVQETRLVISEAPTNRVKLTIDE